MSHERSYVCQLCQKEFTRLHDMKRHLQNIHKNDELHELHELHENDIIKKNCCPICHKTFSRSFYVKKHQETVHKISPVSPPDGVVSTLISEIIDLKSKMEENHDKLILQVKEQLKNNTPANITNNLNIVCVTGHDNYLDMLTDRMGNFEQAIEYIKDCALSDLVGDCKLIEKIYNTDQQTLSFTRDQKKTTIYYLNENNQPCSENRDSFSRKIANNLQNTYLKGVNYLINRNLTMKRDPNQFLADYDLLSWNQHIYQLSELSRQHKILNQLQIPLK